jgi:hypothetical protein
MKHSAASIAGGRSRCGFICGAGSCDRFTSAYGATRYGLKAHVMGERTSAGPVISYSAKRAAISSGAALYRALIQRPVSGPR